MVRILCIALALLATDPAVAQAPSTRGPLTGQDQRRAEIELVEAYFKFVVGDRPETFIFKLTDLTKITQARWYLSNNPRIILNGIIATTAASYNPPWHFHYIPETVGFTELAPEVCDSEIRYVEEHLEEVGGAFLPGNRWCPWGSKLVEEVRVQ